MKTVITKGDFNTTFGHILVVDMKINVNIKLSIGEDILDQHGNKYKIIGFHMPSTSKNFDDYGIIVQRYQ